MQEFIPARKGRIYRSVCRSFLHHAEGRLLQYDRIHTQCYAHTMHAMHNSQYYYSRSMHMHMHTRQSSCSFLTYTYQLVLSMCMHTYMLYTVRVCTGHVLYVKLKKEDYQYELVLFFIIFYSLKQYSQFSTLVVCILCILLLQLEQFLLPLVVQQQYSSRERVRATGSGFWRLFCHPSQENES